MVIYLNNPYEQQRKLYEQGLLNMAMRQWQTDIEKKMLEWKLQKEQEIWEHRQKRQMEMEDERRRKYIKDLLGEQKTEISNMNDIVRVGDIQNDLVNSLPQNPVSRAVNNAFGMPRKQSGFLGKRSGDFFDQVRENFLVNSPAPPSPKLTTRYEGGALSDIANQNPQLATQIKAQVYGIKLPQKKTPKAKFFKTIDVGDKVVPVVVMDNGNVVFDKELYKSLSPKEREELKFKAKKLKEEIRHNKAVEELQKQRIEVGRQRGAMDIDKRLKVLDKAINKMMKKYKLDKGMLFATEPTASNVIETIRKVNPQDAERLQRWYEEYIRLTDEAVGIQEKPKRPAINTNNPFSIFEE